MRLTSPAFADNQPIPGQYTCDGANVSPPLAIGEAPASTKSLALIVHDPDAVSGNFCHWLLWNLAPTTTTLEEAKAPAGAVEGTTDFGKTGYGGPCPPASTGTHRYMFELYALDTVLDLPASANRAELEQAMSGHILEQTRLIGLYQRQ